MSRSVDLSTPKWVQRALAVCVFAALLFPFLHWGFRLAFDVLDVAADARDPLAFGLSLLVCLVACVAWIVRARTWDESGSVWGAIPHEQYTGRFAESGGITRDEQERSLRRLRDDDE